jgi:alkyl hydroperoxide reductase subunit AhpF
MALISPADQERLRESFAEMERPVRLLFFTQTLNCETCVQTRQILDELPPLSDKITIEEVNFVLDGDRAKEYGIDRVPAVAIAYEDAGAEVRGAGGVPGVIKDSRIRFVGTPAGYEFISLVHAILLVGGRESILSADNRARVAGVAQPVRIQVFSTPS